MSDVVVGGPAVVVAVATGGSEDAVQATITVIEARIVIP
jgi:hypothetical protein